METKNSYPATVDEYIARYPQDVQQILLQIRAVIRETAPGAEEKISYNMPGYFLNGFLVSFAVWKRHIGFYPTSTAMEAAIPALSAYPGTKGSAHFRLNQPIPYALIKKIVRFRVAENLKEAHNLSS